MAGVASAGGISTETVKVILPGMAVSSEPFSSTTLNLIAARCALKFKTLLPLL